MFTFRVANSITNRLTLQPSPEDFTAFEVGAKFDLCCIDRTIYLEPSKSGNVVVLEFQPYCCEEFPRSVRRKLNTILPAFTVAEASFDMDGDSLTWEVPQDHELPWSKNAPRNDLEAVVRKQLTLRVDSAIKAEADLKAVAQRVPNWARGVLPGKEWISIFERQAV